nr:2839_t:CDS:2 [Entrophospora candida]
MIKKNNYTFKKETTRDYSFPPQEELIRIRKKFSNPKHEGGNIALLEDADEIEKMKYSVSQSILNYHLETKKSLATIVREIGLTGLTEKKLYDICRGKVNDFSLGELVIYASNLRINFIPCYNCGVNLFPSLSEALILSLREQESLLMKDLDIHKNLALLFWENSPKITKFEQKMKDLRYTPEDVKLAYQIVSQDLFNSLLRTSESKIKLGNLEEMTNPKKEESTNPNNQKPNTLITTLGSLLPFAPLIYEQFTGQKVPQMSGTLVEMQSTLLQIQTSLHSLNQRLTSLESSASQQLNNLTHQFKNLRLTHTKEQKQIEFDRSQEENN